MSHIKNNSVTTEWKNLKCPRCKRTNIGWQKECLFCQTKLLVTSDSSSNCINCGATIKKNQKFCLECGLKVEISSKAPSCPQCGVETDEKQKFCFECGTKI
ncbi:MAG: zinc-ribbon domain-containing protein [Desulfocapsa sp.]|nr:zinc-ribbon domain-containing protein [Desulfocapsa sp.]